MDMYHIVYYFFIYSFLGWCLETIYAYTKNKKFINRGFLYGPLCPIYGSGVLLIIVCSLPIKNIQFSNTLIYFIAIFFDCAIITTILEYITGYLLEKFFNTTWWDYSNRFMNIKGRVCLRFSIIWGLISFFCLEYIHPFIESIVNALPEKSGIFLLEGLIIVFIIDSIFTIKSLIDLQKVLIEMKNVITDLKEELKINADEVMMSKLHGLIESKEQKIINLKQNLANKYLELSKKVETRYSRYFHAFPSMKSKKFNVIIKELKNKVKGIHYKNK